MRPMRWRRRELNRAALWLALGAWAALPGRAQAAPRWRANPFTLGVACGQPPPTASSCGPGWRPSPLSGGGMGREPVRVRWEVADEPGVRGWWPGEAHARAERGHTVHVEVDGLEPDRWYCYRFIAGDEDSPVGRTRTAPAAGAMPAACASPSSRASTTSTASSPRYRHMAARGPRPRRALGDYIYEGARAPRPRAASTPAREPRDARRLPRAATRSTRPTPTCRPRTPPCPGS